MIITWETYMPSFYLVSVRLKFDDKVVSFHDEVFSKIHDFLFYFLERDELAVSLSGRFCTIFSKSLAKFSTELEATDFMNSLPERPGFSYSISRMIN